LVVVGEEDGEEETGESVVVVGEEETGEEDGESVVVVGESVEVAIAANDARTNVLIAVHIVMKSQT
jgi:hypothetical protein